MSDNDRARDAVLGLEPDDLDGHTVDELSDYLADNRHPADRSIDNSPACQIALSALQRLRVLSDDYLTGTPSAAETSSDQDWIARVLAVLPLEARAGRSFSAPVAATDTSLEVTEGALRGLIRSIGDAIPGFLIGAIRIHILDGHADTADLEIEAALRYGTKLSDVDNAFRTALERDLPRHAPFAVRAVHLTIVSLITDARTAR